MAPSHTWATSLDQATNEWTRLLGESHVLGDRGPADGALGHTFAHDARVAVELRPGTVTEVQACVRIAARHRIPLYTVSTARNWGYGTLPPDRGDCVVLRLSRLDRIREYDPELGTVSLEPGVSQGQLAAVLSAEGDQYWLDVTGSSSQCSVLANYIERGFGHSPYADHFAHVCALEVVTADGELLHTGFGRFDNAKAKDAYRWGVGPYLDGLFSQSNLGIVTAMTVWLMPKPEYFQYFHVTLAREDDLHGCVTALRELRRQGFIRSAVHIGNAYKVYSALNTTYPWQETGGRTPLPRKHVDEALERSGGGPWSFSGGLYGTRAQVALARREIRRRLRREVRVRQIRFLDERRLAWIERLAGPLTVVSRTPVRRITALLRALTGIKTGVPTEEMLKSLYWRHTGGVPSEPDPDRDRCGLLWCAPVAPLKGSDAVQLNAIVQEVFDRHGFEPMISMTVISERALDCIIAIHYDRGVPGEDSRALNCHRELLDALTGAGYYPYRLGSHEMEPINHKSAAAWNRTITRLGHALDPQGILAPGRYRPARSADDPDMEGTGEI